MKKIYYIFLLLLIIPILTLGQLKKDENKNNVSISNVLNSSLLNKSFLGILNPDKLKMSHSLSMSYISFGGFNAMVNTYINTINYKFSDKLLLTTKLGIMNSPYNSLPNNSYLNNNQFFGGAALQYKPSENSSIYLSIESNPYSYYRDSLFYSRNPFSISNQ